MRTHKLVHRHVGGLALMAALLASQPARGSWIPEGTLFDSGSWGYSDVALDHHPAGGFVVRFVSLLGANRTRFPQLEYVAGDGMRDPAWSALQWSFAASACSDGAGGAYATQLHSSSGGLQTYILSHVLPTGALDPNWGGVTLSGFVDPTKPEPRPNTDGGGCLIAFNRRTLAPPTAGLYLRRFTELGGNSPGWPLQGVQVRDGGLAHACDVVTDGAGGAFVAFVGAGLDMRVAHVLSNGTLDPTWPGGSVSFGPYTDSGADGGMVLVSSGSKALLVWESTDVDSQRVHVVRFDAASASAGGDWSQTVFTAATGDRLTAFGDGGGGVYVFWQERSPNSDVRGAHLASDGSYVSPTRLRGGSALSIAAVLNPAGRYAAGSAGSGVALAWNDLREGMDSLYVTLLDYDGGGAPLWPLDGALVPVEAVLPPGVRPRGVPQAAAGDGSNFPFVAWSTGGDGSDALRLARVEPPEIGGVPTGTGALSLSAPAPNPARGSLVLRAALPAGGVAHLELLDVSGRRCVHRELAGEGNVSVRLDVGALPPGVYLAKLAQGGALRMRRVAIVR